MPNTKSRTRDVLTIFIIAVAIKVLLGDEIAGFIDGMYLGFTDGI
ncbi:hypothetical protein [Brevundimonas sp.]